MNSINNNTFMKQGGGGETLFGSLKSKGVFQKSDLNKQREIITLDRHHKYKGCSNSKPQLFTVKVTWHSSKYYAGYINFTECTAAK